MVDDQFLSFMIGFGTFWIVFAILFLVLLLLYGEDFPYVIRDKIQYNRNMRKKTKEKMKKQYFAPLKVELVDKKKVSWSKILNIVLALISLGFSMTAFFITQGFQQENRKIEQRYKEQENKKEFRTSPLYLWYGLENAKIGLPSLKIKNRSGTILDIYVVNYWKNKQNQDSFAITEVLKSEKTVEQTDVDGYTIVPENFNLSKESDSPKIIAQMFMIRGTGDKNYLLMYIYDGFNGKASIIDNLTSLSSSSLDPRQEFLDIYQKTKTYLEGKNIKLS